MREDQPQESRESPESDEFAVLTKDENTGGVIALMRMGEAMEALNAAGGSYKARFSVGEATSNPDVSESFRDLVEKAGLVRRERSRAEHVLADSEPAASGVSHRTR